MPDRDDDCDHDRLQTALDLAAVHGLINAPTTQTWARMAPDTTRRQAYDRLTQIHEALIRRVGAQ